MVVLSLDKVASLASKLAVLHTIPFKKDHSCCNRKSLAELCLFLSAMQWAVLWTIAALPTLFFNSGPPQPQQKEEPEDYED